MDEIRYQLSGGVGVHLIWVNIPGYALRHYMCIDGEELDEQIEEYGMPDMAIYGEEVVRFVE